VILPCQKHLFDLPDGITYLDCAYLSPLLDSVHEAGLRGLARKRHPWTLTRADFHNETETVRGLFAGLIGATADDIAIVPATSYGIAVAAANLPLERGQSVVVLEDQHASVVLGWRAAAERQGASLRVVPRPGDGDWTAAVLAALDPSVAVAALPNVHWTDGGRLDLVAIGRRCREVGAALVVDGTQSIGAMPFDVSEVRPDFLVCSAYKWLLCPYTLAFLYAAPHRQDGRPLEEHAFSRKGAEQAEGKTDYTLEFDRGARRYDMGERSNFINLPMAIAALRQLGEWGVANIAGTLAPLVDAAAEAAAELDLEAPPAAHRAPHMIGLRRRNGFAPDLVRALGAQRIHVSMRGDALRLSPHLYNTHADIERLFTALRRHLQGRPRPP
jgi:selenocysteine lyase/cysteine desulfurase